jgi:hypothetical protein
MVKLVTTVLKTLRIFQISEFYKIERCIIFLNLLEIVRNKNKNFSSSSCEGA